MIIFTLEASPVWGFSHLRTQNYISQAQKFKLWNAPQWIKLGHYEKGWFSYSSPFTKGFFLSPAGHKSPELELLKTIELLFSNTTIQTIETSSEITDTSYLKQHIQCRYLARTKWLTTVLNIDPQDIVPCHEMQAWKKQLNGKSVALIFAAADMGNASSSFGHTFLKIINPENAANKDLIDYGMNYAATTGDSEGVLYALKGLLGFYNGQFAMLPYHQKIREYINLEGRDIWEYHLNLTPEEVDFLIDHLVEMELARAPYYFFSDNCSYQILKTLEAVRPEINIADRFKHFVIPIDTVKKLHELSSNYDLKIIASVKYKKSLKTDYLQSYSQLNMLQKKAVSTAVEKLSVPEDYELTPQERAEVLETAMKYYSVRAFRDSANTFENEKYQLYLGRSNLGQQVVTKQTRKEEPPEESHDSSALYWGFGLRDQLNFSSLKFRNAFHDIEQKDFGTVAFSHNEMGSLEIRYNQLKQSTNSVDTSQSEFKNLQIHRFTLLNLVNLNPVTPLDTYTSWRVSAAVMSGWKPDLDLAAGYSFDVDIFQRSRIAYMLAVKSSSAFDQFENYKYLNGLGPNVLFVSRLSENWGFSLDLYYYLIDKNADFFRYKAKFNYTLRKNFDVQIHSENGYDGRSETQAQLVWNFIL